MIRKLIILMLTLGAVGTLVLWVVTLWIEFEFHSRQSWVLFARGGGVSLWWYQGIPPDILSAAQGWKVRQIPSGPIALADCVWVPKSTYDKTVTIPWGVVVIPLWMLFLLFLAYPTLAFIRRPLRRWRKGLCVRCAYDLTGNVSGVCPECGTKIERP